MRQAMRPMKDPIDPRIWNWLTGAKSVMIGHSVSVRTHDQPSPTKRVTAPMQRLLWRVACALLLRAGAKIGVIINVLDLLHQMKINRFTAGRAEWQGCAF